MPPPAAVISIGPDGALLLDGAPYVVRGVAYSLLASYAERFTSPPDLFTLEHRALWERDLAAIAGAGANTLRLYNWDPGQHVSDVSFLDAAIYFGLRVSIPSPCGLWAHGRCSAGTEYKPSAHSWLTAC